GTGLGGSDKPRGRIGGHSARSLRQSSGSEGSPVMRWLAVMPVLAVLNGGGPLALKAAVAGCPSQGFPVAITPMSAHSADLFWQVTPGSLPAGVINYEVFRGFSPTNLIQIATTRIPFYTDISLTPAATFYYQI